jgi:hypothetical protein
MSKHDQAELASNDDVDDATAVKEALADMAAGDTGVSLEDFDWRFRKEFGIADKLLGNEAC